MTPRRRGVGPLAGVRVMDVGTYGVGPGAAAIMGFLGADVIRIENPRGDPFYDNPPTINGVGSSYINANLNKRIILLDLKSEDGLRIGRALSRWADVLMENRLGVLEKLGLGYEDLSRENPNLVYVSSPGFGNTGPYAGRPALDTYVQGLSGFATVGGIEGGTPELFRTFGYLDHAASTFMVQAAILGLVQRKRVGRGAHIEAGHLASSIFIQLTRIADYFESGEPLKPIGTANRWFAPSGAFRCSDGKFVTISAPDDACFVNLCKALKLEKVEADPRFATAESRLENRRQLAEQIEREIAGSPAWWWILHLRRNGVACAPLNLPEDMLREPDLLKESLVSVPTHWGPVWHSDTPWDFSETSTPEVRGTRPPGADDDEITQMLSELEGTA